MDTPWDLWWPWATLGHNLKVIYIIGIITAPLTLDKLIMPYITASVAQEGMYDQPDDSLRFDLGMTLKKDWKLDQFEGHQMYSDFKQGCS